MYLRNYQITYRVNAQCVSTPTTSILPTSVSTYLGLNCFGCVIYLSQSSTYQNIAKLLTHPRDSI